MIPADVRAKVARSVAKLESITCPTDWARAKLDAFREVLTIFEDHDAAEEAERARRAADLDANPYGY